MIGWFRSALSSPTWRPFLLLAGLAVLFAFADAGRGRFLSLATVFSVLQQFATIGPVALALGLSMIIREFDLSIGGVLSLAGCVAVMLGAVNPIIGIAAAIGLGLVAGAIQGGIMVRLGLDSIGVTLGGLLTLGGLAYVLTGNQTIGYPRMDIAMLVNAPLLGIVSLRSLLALAAFAIAAFVMAHTRPGRDTYATGSNRRAARVTGVGVDLIVVGTFAMSGALTAMTGAILSYSLAAASPIALVDALVPATAAAIIGGVSLSGGKGTPVGIAGGVLVLGLLRSGLTSIGAPPYVHEIITGIVLLSVSLLYADDMKRRVVEITRSVHEARNITQAWPRK